MQKRLKLAALSLMMAIGLLVPALASAPVSAQVSEDSKQAACDGLGLGADEGGCNGTAGTSVSSLLADVINILSWIVGIVAVIMIIIGGFKYVLSNGDSAGINSAKNTIIYSLIGLVVAALAQIMVQFVLDRVT